MTLALTDYQQQTHATAIYRDDLALHYLVPGLLVEALEAKEAIHHQVRLRKELGDIMWFVSEIHNCIGTTMQLHDQPPHAGTADLALGHVIAFSRFAADHWIKIVRDKGAVPTADDLARIAADIAPIPHYVAIAADCINTTLPDILAANLDKLRDRQMRGQLSGSGDDR